MWYIALNTFGRPIRKLYYSIGEVSKIVGVAQHVLRYWETEFAQLQPRKNRAGRRVYTSSDLALVQRIHELLRVNKFTLYGARQILDRADAPEDADEARSELIKLRTFLENMRQQLS
ncbi:MAG: MerR family transcriptional regulator [Bacteroidota bacterium]|nr:MerR family transcriptional regulator [Bacteroidota bacterium]MDE2957717.1 MerR family transcriptional regulator [Bacteroidota bacterium]